MQELCGALMVFYIPHASHRLVCIVSARTAHPQIAAITINTQQYSQYPASLKISSGNRLATSIGVLKISSWSCLK